MERTLLRIGSAVMFSKGINGVLCSVFEIGVDRAKLI